MNFTDQSTTKLTKHDGFKIAVTFVVLFVLYHAAEYMILFKNNAAGFLGLQVLFFVAAWLLGRWYRGNGLAAWGLPFRKGIGKLLLIGVLLGVALYAVPYFLSLDIGIERVVKIPGAATILSASLPFAFGVVFSSFSEDVLTRGVVYTFLYKRVPVLGIIVISAAVYLLNHIYRLGSGLDSLLYIFLLGIIFIIPVVFTKNLWLTGAMHWAGNTFFFVTHNAIQTRENGGALTPNYLFALCLALFVPLLWMLCRKVKSEKSKVKTDEVRHAP